MTTHEDVQVTRWLVWGIGSPTPDEAFDAETRSDTRTVAAAHDPAWATDADGWSMIVTARRHELQEWMDRADSARGFAPAEQDTESEPQPVEHPRPY